MFKRKDSSAAANTPDEGVAVQAARTRARRRLIGAALLVGNGIVGFPLLFETQPRPIAVDIPIEIPPREDAAPLKLPATKPSAPTVAVPAEPPAPAPAPSAERAAAAAQVVAPPSSASAANGSRAVSRAERENEAAAPSAPPRVATEAQRGAADAPREVPREVPRTPSEPQREAQRAQAILEGKPLAAAVQPASVAGQAPRFVVQAGAYTDAGTLRQARQKVEKLGLKTYTQVVESDAGRRTRVRVGPFDSRDDAEKAAARIKSAGLAASILSL